MDQQQYPKIDAYLVFNGRCDEAIEFYRKALGAEVLMLARFKDRPEMIEQGMVRRDLADKVMHASMRIGATTVMASDGQGTGPLSFQGISLSIAAADEAQAQRLFNNLADGGTVRMPLGKTFFSPCFGMLADRFGVSWMVITAH